MGSQEFTRDWISFILAVAGFGRLAADWVIEPGHARGGRPKN